MAYTESDINSLTDKIGARDLSAGEQAALEAVFNEALAGDVEGFQFIAGPADKDPQTVGEWMRWVEKNGPRLPIFGESGRGTLGKG